MFRMVLIGIDGGAGGRDAVRLARELAAPGAQLVLTHIWEDGAGLAAAATGSDHPAAVGHELVRAEQLAGDFDCATDVRSGSSVAAGLHEAAEALGCDLLVVGSPRYQARGRTLVGGPLRAALHGAPCAIAVAPRSYAAAERASRDVGLGYEETDLGDAALAVARAIARARAGKLHATLVIPPLPSPWLSEPYAYLAELDDLLSDRVTAARTRLETLEDCTVDVLRGEPAERLLELSTRVGLLVLGSRGYGPVRRLLFGSTSDEVVQDAACAVLVLTRPATDAFGVGKRRVSSTANTSTEAVTTR